jgi:hypothetical protein
MNLLTKKKEDLEEKDKLRLQKKGGRQSFKGQRQVCHKGTGM